MPSPAHVPLAPAAAGKRRAPHGPKKRGFLGGLFKGSSGGRGEEEEGAGAAVPGSPRMMHVERPPAAAPPQHMAGPAPMAGHPTTTTATTTATYTVAVPVAGGAAARGSPAGVPLSTPAAPVRAA